MSLNYNVTGTKRKALVKAISEILALEAVYKGAPSFAYEIGGCVVDKSGTLILPEELGSAAEAALIAALKERGYDALEELVIEIPLEGFSNIALDNLKHIVISKKKLIKKVFGAKDLPIETTEDRLRFPWFTLNRIDGEADAYSRFICAICEMAKKQERVIAKERDTGNDKFTFRLFLVRLGFVGKEYAAARKILLRNLTGNSSWKDGQPPKKVEGEP